MIKDRSPLVYNPWLADKKIIFNNKLGECECGREGRLLYSIFDKKWLCEKCYHKPGLKEFRQLKIC